MHQHLNRGFSTSDYSILPVCSRPPPVRFLKNTANLLSSRYFLIKKIGQISDTRDSWVKTENFPTAGLRHRSAMEDGAHEMIMKKICGDSGVVNYCPGLLFSSEALIFPIVPVSVCMCPLAFVFPPRDMSLYVYRDYNIFLLTL